MITSNRICSAVILVVKLGSFALLALAVGCGSSTDSVATSKKKPRPVEVQTLQRGLPPTSALVTASVASWKTEQIGFEVSGRIEWVAEPNTDIEGRVVDANGELLVSGTPIARVESERYELQRDTAAAEVKRAEYSVSAATIELKESLPSQMRAALAEKKLAETEFERSKLLVQQNAAAQSDVDRDEANLRTAESKIQQLQASINAKEAELLSLSLQVQQAKQAFRDAERSLEDCTLYSSFRGQIAEVSVVPGSVISAGTPVATIQMMDPIKIEVEVSSEDSRRLRKQQRLEVRVPQPDGSNKPMDGFLYLIDPVADPLTRTFTLTLLLMNKKNGTVLPAGATEDTPITDQAWRLDFSFLPGAQKGMTYVAEEAVRRDDEGHFLWRINNFQMHQTMPSDGVIKVSKLRVKLGSSRLPFLGNWIFQQVHVLDDEFDPLVELVAGELIVNDGNPDDWTGDTILIDRTSQWMARPGDLVKVNLSDGNAEPGYFVPMDAIAREAGRAFLFVVDETTGSETVSRMEVSVQDEPHPTLESSPGEVAPADAPPTPSTATSSLMRIESPGDQSLEGLRYVTRGVHYLRDGEPVRITQRAGASQ